MMYNIHNEYFLKERYINDIIFSLENKYENFWTYFWKL